MYQKICKHCNELITVEAQVNFASHVSGCKHNPELEERYKNYSLARKGKLKVDRLTLEKICPKCGTNFTVTDTESNFRNNKVKNYCSRKCSNSKTFSEETKLKKSESAKNSEKCKLATENSRGVPKPRHKIIHDFICQYCGEPGKDYKNNPNRKYHGKCWLKVSGGIKPGSSRGKCGWYKGYWCDSSYELAYIIYCLDHDITITRNTQGFEYTHQGKMALFYPDFIVENGYVEIKNYRSELTDDKLRYFPHDISIYYRDTISPILEYVISVYGKKYVGLYEIR